MKPEIFSVNTLLGITLLFLTAAVIAAIVDHYKTKRLAFEESLTEGQTVKVVNPSTKKIESTWIKSIDTRKNQVETDLGSYTFKQLLS